MTTLNATFARYADRKVPRYTSYPTAPHFHDGVGIDEAAKWMKELPADGVLSLYLHVPFCHSMCSYCGCHTKVTKRYHPVGVYAEHLDKELKNTACHLPGPMKVSHVHWGGGTPTMLSRDNFIQMMNTMRESYRLEDDSEVAIEIDPRTLDEECISMLSEGGVTRASLGVQDFNDHVQEAIGRPQSFEMTEDSVIRLRDAGIKAINFDLMYGLPLQTLDDVIRSMEMTARIRPDRIALFGYAHVPWFKPHQKLISEADLPGHSERFEQTEAAAEELVRLGYVRIGLDHFALPDDSMAIAQEQGRLRRNFQGYTTDEADAMLPFGASSIGKLPQGYIQNIVDIGGWKRQTDTGELTVARGFDFNDDDLLRSDIIEAIMCNLAVDLEDVCSRYGKQADDLDAELAEIDTLARDGLVARDGYKLEVPEKNRPFIRIVAAVFDTYLKKSEKRHSVAV